MGVVNVAVTLQQPFTLTDLVAFIDAARANKCRFDEPVGVSFTTTGSNHHFLVDGEPMTTGYTTLHAPAQTDNLVGVPMFGFQALTRRGMKTTTTPKDSPP